MLMISKKSKNAKNIIRFSKKVVITMLISVMVFTITMIVIYLIKGSVPDTLITEFFGFFKVEGGALSVIKAVETGYDFVMRVRNKKLTRQSTDDNNITGV